MFNPIHFLFVVLFLLFTVQCAPTRPSPSPSPSPSSGGTLCQFKCPQYDLAGFKLGSDSASDSARLYCTYPIAEHSTERYNCKYNKNTGILLSDANSSECPHKADFSCLGTRNAKRAAEKPRDLFKRGSGALPQFVKARSAKPDVAVEL